MDEIFILQGCRVSTGEQAQVAELVSAHTNWSRYRLSRELAQRSGQPKHIAAQTFLLKLEKRGLSRLPLRRRASPDRMRHKQMPCLDPSFNQEPMQAKLTSVLPLQLQEVSSAQASDRALFETLLHQFHYLSHLSPVGENLGYLVREQTGRPVACLLSVAAAWQCADLD